GRAMSDGELAALEDAGGAPIPDELRALLSAGPATRVQFGFGSAMWSAFELNFEWIAPGELAHETRKLDLAVEEYGWELAACVPLSMTNNTFLAYRLGARDFVRVDGDDGEVEELGFGLDGFLERYRDGLAAELEA